VLGCQQRNKHSIFTTRCHVFRRNRSFLLCGNGRRNRIPQGVCTQTTASSTRSCPARPQCQQTEELEVTTPADPASGRCCPEFQCRQRVRVAPSASACWAPTSGTLTAYPTSSLRCQDGSVSGRICRCNSADFDVFAPGVCVGQPVSATSVPCPNPCADDEKLIVDTPADPAKGVCCPTGRCVKNAATADACWYHEPQHSSFTTYPFVRIICIDGTVYSGCGCTNYNNERAIPPGVCEGSEIRSMTTSACETPDCPAGQQRGFIVGQEAQAAFADPANGKCCPDSVTCVWDRPRAQASDVTQFNGNSDSSSDSVPAYAIALFVIGGLILLALISVMVILARDFHN